MAKILYINAHPSDVAYSKSQQVGEIFLKDYLTANPQDEVTHVNLWELDAPDVDVVVYSAFGHLMSGGAFEDLSADQQKALMKRQAVIDQFIAHDKYIFVAPMWEYSFPAVLKKYLDIICVARQTFKYNDIGMQAGLLENKKAVFIQASGGNYTPEARKQFRQVVEAHADAAKLLPAFDSFGNFGEAIVRANLMAMGVSDYNHIMIHSQSMPNFAASVLQATTEQAKQLAATW